MRATLTFSLPEEHREHAAAVAGPAALAALHELDNRLRAAIKYDERPEAARRALEEVREWLAAEMQGLPEL